MVSIETLEMEMKHLKEGMDELKDWQEKILETLNNLDDRYATRREFKAVTSVLWAVATGLWILAFFLWLK